MSDEWVSEFPKEGGYYWFYGRRFGNSKLSKDADKELMLVEVSKNERGFIYVANGQFMFRGEPTDYHFQKAELPKLPDGKDWEMV